MEKVEKTFYMYDLTPILTDFANSYKVTRNLGNSDDSIEFNGFLTEPLFEMVSDIGFGRVSPESANSVNQWAYLHSLVIFQKLHF